MSGTGRTPPGGPGDPRDRDRPDFTPPGAADQTQLIPGPGTPETRTAVQPAPAPAPSPAGPPERRKPRSRSVMIAVISVLAVLAVLIAGDRVANAVAQNTIAGRLQTELSTPAKPDVSIGGFPFVSQLLNGSFSSVQVTAEDATVADGDTTVEVARLDATLTGITATDRFSTIVAGRGEATALVDWDSISTLATQRVGYEADDRMRIDFSVPIGRLSIDGYITGRPELNVDDQTIVVADPQVNLASVDVPEAVVDAVSRVVLRPFAIENLPYDIQVTGLTVQPDGILLNGTGSDIPLRGR